MKRLLIIALVILSVMLIATSCGKQKVPEDTTEADGTAEQSETANADTSAIRTEPGTEEETQPDTRVDISNFIIVLSDTPTAGEQAAADYIANAVSKVYGKELKVQNSFAPGDFVILVGSAAVNQSQTPANPNDYAATVAEDGNSVSISGGNDEAIKSAATHFCGLNFGYASDEYFTPQAESKLDLLSIDGCLTAQLTDLFDGIESSVANYPYFSALKVESEGGYSGATGANGIFANFSGVSGTNCLVYQFGNEACYFEWVADKIMATSDTGYKNALKAKIQNYPQTDTGYFWSWSSTTYWPTGDGDMHYDGTFRYVAAVYDVIRWENSTEFLNAVDSNGGTEGLDASKGKTVYEKCELAMDYALNQLYGKNGVIRITADSMILSDGVTRIDQKGDELLWNNTGCVGSCPSNYWDNLCFGNYDAYETALFYHALDAMAGIETMLGNTQKAENYANVMKLVHEKFDETFWDAEKGRYIATIDTEGNRIDFGFTFLNTEALYYGLGDAEKAALILDWIDGERIVEGDTTTGKDILSYTSILNAIRSKNKKLTDEMYLAPITNTVPIESYKTADKQYWWYSLNGNINVGKKGDNAAYGKHLENGGYIFYTVFYELMARTKYLGGSSTMNRYEQIAKVYEYNGLNSDIGTWIEGLCGEFPESGMASTPYVYSLVGADATTAGLQISPNVPDSCKYVGMRDFSYANQTFDLIATANSFALKAREPGIKANLIYAPSGYDTYSVTVYGADGNVELTKVFSVKDGCSIDSANASLIVFEAIK